MNNSPEIRVLVGLPGSGKSTYIKKLQSEFDYLGIYKPHWKYAVISTDDLIKDLGYKFSRSYNACFRDLIDLAGKLVKIQFRYALEDGFNIMYDQTNLTTEKRHSILSQVPDGYRKIAVVFDPPFDILKDRLAKREKDTGKTISLNIVEDMQKRFVYPTLQEGFDEIRVEDHVNEQRDPTNTRDAS